MELEITKFMRMMELRSASMFRFIKEFAEWYQKEYHIHVELTNGSLTPNDYYIYNLHCQIYDDISINEYDSAGRGHQLLRLVNSNLKKVTDILGNVLRYNILNDDNRVIEMQVAKQMHELKKDQPEDEESNEVEDADSYLSKKGYYPGQYSSNNNNRPIGYTLDGDPFKTYDEWKKW